MGNGTHVTVLVLVIAITVEGIVVIIAVAMARVIVQVILFVIVRVLAIRSNIITKTANCCNSDNHINSNSNKGQRSNDSTNHADYHGG